MLSFLRIGSVISNVVRDSSTILNITHSDLID